MLNIIEEQKIDIVKNNHYWVIINGKRYYVKKHRVGILFSEIIAKRVFDILNIKNANYEAVLIDNELYYLSEDLKALGNYVSSEILQVKVASLHDYWNSFQKLYNTSARELMDELVKVYLFDIIMMHEDRNCGNWGILDGLHICTFDNELILALNARSKITSSYVSEREIPYNKYKPKVYRPFYKQESGLKEFEDFMNNFSKEYISIGERVLNSITPEVLKAIMEDIEKEYDTHIDDKETRLARFTENYEALQEILKRAKGLAL